MLRLTIISIILMCLSVKVASGSLPDFYSYQYFFQVNIFSTIVYSPTQTSVIYSDNDTQCFVFRESLQEDESPEKQICLNDSIFSINYNPQADKVYVTTNVNNESSSSYSLYAFDIKNGMIEYTSRKIFARAFDSQEVGYPIVDISKDGQVAIYLLGDLVVVQETNHGAKQFSQNAKTLKLNYEVVELTWHPLDKNLLFIAGVRTNEIYNVQTQQNIFISNLTTIHMNIMFNGSVILLQSQDFQLNLSRVNVFSFLNNRVIFVESYIDFVLYKPGLCSLQGNIMGLVKDLSQLHIYNATYQDEELIGGTFIFTKLDVIEFIPGISDGSMAVDGSQIYLRGYNPIQKLTRCAIGMYQAGQSCEACSTNCHTCHINANSCTSCYSGFFVSNQKCLACNIQVKACTACTPAGCLTCNETANFFVFPSDNKCTCKYGTFLTNNGTECKWCKYVLDGCQSCENSEKCLKCLEGYEQNDDGINCKQKSKAWIIGVAVGSAVLLILGIGGLVWWIRRKRRTKSSEGYQRFGEDNSAITHKKQSFIKSISSEKSSFEGEKVADIVEENNQISSQVSVKQQVSAKKPMDGRVDGKDVGMAREVPKNDGNAQ